MKVDVKIDPEQINAMLVTAILGSAIGEEIQKAVDEEVARLSRSWDNPINKCVERVVNEQIYTLVRDEYGEAIKETVRNCVTEEIVALAGQKAWETFMQVLGQR